MSFHLRPARDEDIGYVLASWYAAQKHSRAGQDDGESYQERQNARMRWVLASPETFITVAYAEGDEDALAGFCVRSASRIYYVYVTRSARRLGLARQLVGDVSGVTEFCARPIVGEVWRCIPSTWRYARDAIVPSEVTHVHRDKVANVA